MPRNAKSEARHDYRVAADIIENLYYDYAKNRRHIYLTNFLRGIFFGFGAFLGGTILVALIVALLSWLNYLFPDFSDFFTWLVDALSKK